MRCALVFLDRKIAVHGHILDPLHGVCRPKNLDQFYIVVLARPKMHFTLAWAGEGEWGA